MKEKLIYVPRKSKSSPTIHMPGQLTDVLKPVEEILLPGRMSARLAGRERAATRSLLVLRTASPPALLEEMPGAGGVAVRCIPNPC
jgi:hypothetical protein